MGVRHSAKHITSSCLIEPLMGDSVVTTLAMPQNINLYGYLFDNKKEKIKICVCVCVCTLNGKKTGEPPPILREIH